MKVRRICAATVLIAAGLVVAPLRATAASQVIGWLDSVSFGSDAVATFTGWALTSDYPTTAVGVRVVISSSNRPFYNYRLANQYRPDVGAAYPGYGNYHGFSFTAPIPNGYNISYCIEGQNNGVYNILNNGCQTLSFVNGTFGRLEGGAWAQNPGSTLFLTYATSGATYKSNITSGVSAWSGAPRISASLQPDNSASSVNYHVGNYAAYFAANGSAGAYAQTVLNSPCMSGFYYSTIPVYNCNYSHADVYLNTETMNSLADSHRTKIASHEFGHAFGLYHPPAPGVPTVMAMGAPGGNVAGSPQTFDLNSAAMMYP